MLFSLYQMQERMSNITKLEHTVLNVLYLILFVILVLCVLLYCIILLHCIVLFCVFILSAISPYTTGLKALFNQPDFTSTSPTDK